MKKYLLIISFVLISLLAITTVSAADDYNASDSILSEDMNYIDNHSAIDYLDESIDETSSIGEEQHNQSDEISFKDDDTTDLLKEDSVDSNQAKGSDSNESPISEDVIGAINDENNNSNTVLTENEEVNNAFNFTNIFNNIINYINSSNPNILNIIEKIYNNEINITPVITGLINEINFNYTDILNNITDFNIKGFIEGLNETISGISINYTNIINELSNISLISDFNITKIIEGFNLNITLLNNTALTNPLENIFNELNITNENILNKFDEIKNSLGLNLSDELESEINLIKAEESLNLTRIISLLNDVINYNNLTAFEVIASYSNFTNESSLNISDIVQKIKELNVNMSKFEDAYNKIYEYAFGIITNSTISNLLDGFKNISSSFSLNMSNAYQKMIEILNGISFNISELESINVNLGSLLTKLTEYNFSDNILNEVLPNIANNYIFDNTLKLGNIILVISDLIKNNNLTLEDINNITSIFSDGNSFNITNIMSNLTNFNLSSIGNVLKQINLNTSEMLNKLYDLMNSSDFNHTMFIEGLSKIINAYKNYTENIMSGIKFNTGITEQISDIITKSVSYDYLKIFNGVYKMLNASKDYSSKINEMISNIPNATALIYDNIKDYLAGLSKDNSTTKETSVKNNTNVAKSTSTAKPKASKITASAKTFKKSQKTKKYTVTLKSGKTPIKKVKITLKIKGKTYSATTNAKGKATFKITKLTKKGKYTAAIKFKGNKLYKASSKKVKINIK